MRFPFFATNRSLDEETEHSRLLRVELWEETGKIHNRLQESEEYQNKLETRIAALEVWKNHGRKKRK